LPYYVERKVAEFVKTEEICYLCSHGLNTPETHKDVADYCYIDPYGQYHCKLCNSSFERKFSYILHAHSESFHIDMKNRGKQDKADHCHESDDGSLFCDLCNVDIEETYEQHWLCPTHISKRIAFLKLDEVPSLLAQDRVDEVKQIFEDNAN